MAQADFPPELLESLRALEHVLPLQADLETTLTKISKVSVRLVAGCDSASITVVEGGEARTPGASDEAATELDQAQYDSGSGPCLEAIEQARIVEVDDLEGEKRWPEFARSALEHGFSSSLSVPIKIDGVTGGLNLYGRSKNGFRQTPRELTELLAARASVAIGNAKVYGASQRLIEQLNEAIKTREIIGEAKGILMAREGVSEDHAFQMLVTASQNSNTKLRDIALKLVEQTTNNSEG
jgi:GAF domain-containing protein